MAKKLKNDEETAQRLRRHILKMIYGAKSGHPGGSFSALEILQCLFSEVIRFDSEKPQWEGRDRVVLSKGHAVPAYYAILAECGYFPEDWLWTFRHQGSPLQGHPDPVRLPAVEAATGSLGQGLSIAQGMAMALQLKSSESKVFCLIGDGESQEGQIWEVAMSAPKFKLTNLVVVLDYNHGQIDGRSDEVMSLEPVADKWKAFNWNVVEVDGHDRGALSKALQTTHSSKPTFVLAETLKGKGVSFMEGVMDWHGKAPNEEEYAKAMKELGA